MLRLLVFLYASILVFSGVTAQNLYFLDSLENNMNGQAVTFSGQDLNTTHTIYLKTRNTSGNYMNVKVRRYELNVIPNTQNYFCWTNCYAPVDAGAQPVWTDPFDVGMVTDSVYEKFSAYYIPNGIAGVSSFRFVLFDVNNPDDSSYVDILFDIAAGEEELLNQEAVRVYPNPASDVLFLSSPCDSFEIHNILGEKMEAAISFTDGPQKGIDINHFNEGIYFLTLKSGNKSITRKIIFSP